jgi:hypothetical protein
VSGQSIVRALPGVLIACALFVAVDLGVQMLAKGLTLDQALAGLPSRAWNLLPWLALYALFRMVFTSSREAVQS